MPIRRVGKRKKQACPPFSWNCARTTVGLGVWIRAWHSCVFSTERPPLKNNEKAVKSSFQVGELLQLCPWLPSLSVFATTKLSCRPWETMPCLEPLSFWPSLAQTEPRFKKLSALKVTSHTSESDHLNNLTRIPREIYYSDVLMIALSHIVGSLTQPSRKSMSSPLYSFVLRVIFGEEIDRWSGI